MHDDLDELMDDAPPVGKNIDHARAELVAAMSKLSARHQKFVAAYLSHGKGKQAAIEAGFSPVSAATRAWRLLHESPEIMAVVEMARNTLAEQCVYTVERAMAELDIAIARASEANQINAMVKAIECKSRLHGLLIDRQQVEVETKPNLRDAIQIARERAEERTRQLLLEQRTITDVDFRTVGSIPGST